MTANCNPERDLRFEFERSYVENLVISSPNTGIDFWYQRIAKAALLPSPRFPQEYGNRTLAIHKRDDCQIVSIVMVGPTERQATETLLTLRVQKR